MWVLRFFSDPRFFCFQLYSSVDLNKSPKRCLNDLNLNLSCMWALSMAIILDLSS